MELTSRAIERRLAREPRAVLATLRPDGSAALVPIVFARVGDALWSPIDAKPKRTAALGRIANVMRDPRASLLLDHYGADWSLLWWLRIEGRASVERARLEAAAGALRAKYAQYATTPLFAGEPTLLRVEIQRVASWAASEEAARAAEVEE